MVLTVYLTSLNPQGCLSAQFYLQGPSSFHPFTPSVLARGLFAFMFVTSCSKMAAVTPDVTSSHNPGEDPAEEQKKSLSQKPPWPELDFIAILKLPGRKELGVLPGEPNGVCHKLLPS